MKVIKYTALACLGVSALFSCKNDDPETVVKPSIDIPATYEFTRDGASTISYSGQTQRLWQLKDMGSYFGKGTSEQLDLDRIKNQFKNSPSAVWTNSVIEVGSSKKLSDKIYGIPSSDEPKSVDDGKATYDQMLGYISNLVEASKSFSVDAENGKAGVVKSGSKAYLVDSNGVEWSQVIQKTLMGAVFYHQVVNIYLGDGKMSKQNKTKASGADYSDLEHQFDEAYGYIDFPLNPDSITIKAANKQLLYWASYSVQRSENANEKNIGYNIASVLHEQFRKGRKDITNNFGAENPNYQFRDEARAEIKKQFELLIASSAIHYLNAGKGSLTDQAVKSHALSEGIGFIESLRFTNNGNGRIKSSDVAAIKVALGANLWDADETRITAAKTILLNAYPELANVADTL